MPILDIAYLREQGQDMIIAPFDSSFDGEAVADQHAVVSDIQLASYRAGLRGRAMVIWETRLGETRFIAPLQFSSFFHRTKLSGIISQLNRTLSW